MDLTAPGDSYMIQSDADNIADIIKAFTRLVEVFVASFGKWGTLAIFGVALLLAISWRLYNDYRKDKEVNGIIAEKDRTIRRLADQERHYRILFFQEKAGWTDEQIERFLGGENEDDEE